MVTLAEYLILDNTDAEIAGVVDIDTYETLPLVAVGANRTDMLKAFIDRYGDVVPHIARDDLQIAFVAFLQSTGVLPQGTETDDAPNPVESPGGYPSDGGRMLADAEAAGATDVPQPQPADSDMEADAGASMVTVRCFNCEGEGVLRFGDDSPDQKCNTCNGSGKLSMPQAA